MISKYDQYKKVRLPKKKYGRRCRVCGMPLSEKNPNDCCWCHTLVGFEIKHDVQTRKAYEASKKSRLKKNSKKR